MAKDFEGRFFDQLEGAVAEVRADIKSLSRKVDKNTDLTQSVSSRVDKLDSKVFKKQSSIGNLFQDRQIVGAFALALLVFLLILASILKVKVPTL